MTVENAIQLATKPLLFFSFSYYWFDKQLCCICIIKKHCLQMIDKYKKRSAWLNDIYLNVSLHILIANIIASFQGPVR